MENLSIVNHSSFLVENDEISILTDPWFKGQAFDYGWSLIYENNEEDIKYLISRLTHIYISHEHPDHFSLDFFISYKYLLNEKNVTILFQKTKDKRVLNFFRKIINLKVIEVDNNWIYLSKNNKCRIFRNGIIDSAIVLETKEVVYININDCDFDYLSLCSIKKKINHEKPKILFKQFSYAAWRATDEWLIKAAKFKIESFIENAKFLKVDILIPFASFAFFSHEDNFHLNKHINTPLKISNYFISEKIKFTFMLPWPNLISTFDLIYNENIRKEINNNGLKFWNEHYSKLKINYFNKNLNEILKSDFDNFLKDISLTNNLTLMKFIRYLTFGKIFGDVLIFISDKNIVYKIGFNKIKQINPNNKHHISMNFNSFYNMITKIYGVDTISINGKFKENIKDGFLTFVLCLGFKTFNSSGIGINFKDLNLKFISRFLVFRR